MAKHGERAAVRVAVLLSRAMAETAIVLMRSAADETRSEARAALFIATHTSRRAVERHHG